MPPRKGPRPPPRRAPPSAERRVRAIGGALEAFRRASGALHQVTRRASRDEYGLADALLLHAIDTGEVATPGDIASFTGLTSGSVTSLVDRLETAGYVERRRSAEDRRVVLVRLTPKARASLAATMARAHREIVAIFGAWPIADIETLARLLGRLPRGRTRP